MMPHIVQLDLENADYRSPDYQCALGVQNVADAQYDSTGQLWLRSLDGIVHCYDFANNVSVPHFGTVNCLALCVSSEVGYIGTGDGELYAFDVNAKQLQYLMRAPDQCEILSISVDVRRERIFISTHYNIFVSSYRGSLVGQWSCRIPPFRIIFAKKSGKLWSVSDGAEVIDFDRQQSDLCGRRSQCGYCDLCEAADGTIACFGGAIDLLDFRGEATGFVQSLFGGFNGGRFVRVNHIVARAVEPIARPTVQLIRCRSEHLVVDVVPSCEDLAISPSGAEVAVIRDGCIFQFGINETLAR